MAPATNSIAVYVVKIPNEIATQEDGETYNSTLVSVHCPRPEKRQEAYQLQP